MSPTFPAKISSMKLLFLDQIKYYKTDLLPIATSKSIARSATNEGTPYFYDADPLILQEDNMLPLRKFDLICCLFVTSAVKFAPYQQIFGLITKE
jgi:hypothetical protein